MTAMEKADPIDKSAWGPGPWQDEPDRLEFEHAGFPCLIVRNDLFGNLCGYVGMPPGHPWHGQSLSDVDVDVHGGLTFASGCSGHICHVPKPGQPDDVYWIGFDCGHGGIDVMPGHAAMLTKALPQEMRISIENGMALLYGYRETYKDIAYVRQECERLAEQARARAESPPP